MVEWLIQIVLQLAVICQFSRHYNDKVRYLWNIHACIHIFHNLMDRFECDGLHDEKLLRSCEEFDSLNENRLISFDQQAICN